MASISNQTVHSPASSYVRNAEAERITIVSIESTPTSLQIKGTNSELLTSHYLEKSLSVSYHKLCIHVEAGEGKF